MFYFITHLPGSVCFLHSYAVDDLQTAFKEFAEKAWSDNLLPAVGVWHGNFLVAQVLPIYNRRTGVYEPVLIEIESP